MHSSERLSGRVLITGSAGFIGSHLVRRCVDLGCDVLGTGLSEPPAAIPGYAFEPCDVRDAAAVNRVIASFRPGTIFHLAAQSFPTVSMLQPAETMETNATGTIHVFEAVRAAGILPKVVVACSSAEYGFVAAEDIPVKETHALAPLHPYGVSKVAQDLLAYQYFKNYGIPSIRIRIFNTTGPGKTGDVCSDLTRRVAEIGLGLREPRLAAGNLSSRRALLDVRDMVRALILSAERCQAGDVFNVGGKTAYSVAEIIGWIRELSGESFEVFQEASLMRLSDEPVIHGDTSKFEQACGWQPEIPLRSTLQDMLDWWRERLAADARPAVVTHE